MAKERGWLLIVWFQCTVLFSGKGSVNAQSSLETCPLLGSDTRSPFLSSSNAKLFMNFGAPAQCSGTVTSWQYCSYNRYLDEDDECDDRERYTSIFLVYRQTGPSTYQVVSGSRKSVTISLRCPRDGGFRCDRSYALTSSEQFDIQENDIVAACLKGTGSTNPIQLVGEESSGASRGVYWYNDNRYSSCTSSQLQTIDTQNSAFTLGGGVYRLHLYAETNSPVAQCSGGSNPPPFTPSTNSGTYFNTDNPITCSDTITSWHYCYYPSQASDSQLTYTATVGVWRLDTATDQYELLQGSDYTLQLVQPASTPAVIFCKTELLQPQDYVRVETGDIIGVSLPAQNPLPIVASGATGYSLKAQNVPSTPSMIQQSTLSDASNMALHLYPKLESIPIPATEPPTTTEAPPTTTEAPPTTTEAPPTTTEAPPTTTPPAASEAITIAEGDHVTTSEEELLANIVTLGDTSNERDNAVAIAIGVTLLILVVVIVVVIVVMAYRKKLFGAVKRNTSRYRNLLEVSLLGRGSSEQGLVSPYYEKINDYVYDTVLPHYEFEEHTILHKTPDPQVYYSQIEVDSGPVYSLLEEEEESQSENGEDPYYSPAKEESELYAQLHKQGIKMIRTKDIEITGVLGSGQFGTVRKGVWTDEGHSKHEVAIKTLKTDSDEVEKVKFLQEAAIMAQFKHTNVVSLYGVVSTCGILMIVVELLPKGDLKQHLISMKPDPGLLLPSFTPKKLLSFCQQIALGMQYLASKGFVHRDLAARNILLSEGCICKIADFGMSRDLAEDDYYVSQGGKVPIKWTAPEALHFKKYSTASDVWSYGCVLYEIWSLGHKPFATMLNPEVVRKVGSGYRLPPPPGSPKAIYRLMMDCWHPSTAHRPGFRSILLALLEKEEAILSIPSDMGENSQAAVLGAPIEAGFNMYMELQTMYSVDLA